MAELFTRLFSGCSSEQGPACQLGYFGLQAGVAAIADLGFSETMPVTQDMRINSPFLEDVLNPHREPFVGISINNFSDEDYMLFRLLGDSQAPPDSFPYGGRTWAAGAEYATATLFVSGVLARIFEQPMASYWFFGKFAIMRQIDRFWDTLSSPHQGSDGVVQASSQIYPGHEFRYDINEADSHLGETRSPLVRNEIFEALRVLGVPTKD